MQTLNVNEVEHFKCAKDCGYCKLHSRCFETVAISLNRILWFQFMLSVNLNPFAGTHYTLDQPTLHLRILFK